MFALRTHRQHCPDLSKANLLVCPSRYEGLPNVVLEAMAIGVPVVAASVGGIPELIEDGVTGKLVPPASATELANAITEAIRADSTKLHRWSLNAVEKIKRDYSLRNYMKTIEEIFATVRPLLGEAEITSRVRQVSGPSSILAS